MKKAFKEFPRLNGWAGKFLKVDLTTGEMEAQPISMDDMTKCIGGSGLAGHVLYEEVLPEIKPLSPENIVIFSVGPLVGTLAPTSGRATLTSKSPMTGIFGDSSVGGTWGSRLKFAGWDYIIIKGQSPNPVYLWINDDKVEIRDASHLWGKDTWTTGRMIKSELGDPNISVACIGPAGENLSLAGCVIVDYARAWGRCSFGAVLGYKRLKAIAVRGTKGVKIAHKTEFEQYSRKMYERIGSDPIYEPFSRSGTIFWGEAYHIVGYESWGYYQTRNHSGRWSEGDKLGTGSFWNQVFEKCKACFNCPLHCGHYSKIKEGPYAGEKGGGPEYNAMVDFACYPLIPDPKFVVKCNNICNRLGLGVDEVGCAIAFAMTLYQKGIINKEDTGGLEITHGNEEVVLKLIEDICYRRGFGDILADGARKASEKLGSHTKKYAMHIKGLDLIGELRYPLGYLLGWCVSSRGVDYLRGAPILEPFGPPFITFEVKKEIGEKLWSSANALMDTHTNIDGKARAVSWIENLMAVTNACGVCTFVTFWGLSNGYQMEDMAYLLSTATGIDFSPETLWKIGERIVATEKSYNAREGIRRKDDYPPNLFFETPIEVGTPPKKVAHDRRLYDRMLTEYYEIRGYDPETAIPKQKKLKELGLEEVAEDLVKRGLVD